MIHNSDRSGWFGASDTARIMGRWDTPGFARWWAEKLGLIHNTFTTPAMRAGTAYEHRILEAMGITRMDRQIKIPKLRLRVNLDGEDREMITEVKTYGDVFKIMPYWGQCQVEVFAAKKLCRIAAYKLLPEDYRNYFNPIDPERLTFYPIPRNDEWLEKEYLPRLVTLAAALRKGGLPRESDVRYPARIYRCV